MMLMVSVQNLAEALEAVKGGADIVDIKNLQEALVGSGHPMVAKEVRAAVPAEKHVSITLGVVPNQIGTVAMARINPDIVGVRGAVCMTGDRTTAVAWEAVAEFKRQVDLRKSGEIDVFGEAVPIFRNGDGWIVIDGTGKTCAGIIAALTKQV